MGIGIETIRRNCGENRLGMHVIAFCLKEFSEPLCGKKQSDIKEIV
jgi:hypothetical protein